MIFLDLIGGIVVAGLIALGVVWAFENVEIKNENEKEKE